MTPPAARLERLLRSARWGLSRDLHRRDLLPMLEHLLAAAPRGSEACLLAQRNLARLLVAEQPFRAARLAREALATAEDEQTYAVLGIAHTLLGNYRSARRAYGRGLGLDPGHLCCLHNLGHLLDVAFDRPAAALPYLRAAHLLLPDEPEVTASFAHALARAGDLERARRLLRRALGNADADRLLAEWVGVEAKARPETGAASA
ncbi:MAG TPA: hypothetical protein PLU22_00350 [Polyangiaceae bacterium]|nr:hypothetical protein [Polyangiaceae bacterium]